MQKKINSGKTFRILEKLPENLKEVLFSLDTADHIGNICKKFNVPAEKISLIAETIGDVLSKTLPLEDFEKTLEKRTGLKKGQAEDVSREANFRIFSQVRESLTTTAQKVLPEKKGSTPAERLSKRPLGKDIYREKIE